MERRIGTVLRANVDALSATDALERITFWAKRRESRSVAICNVHLVVTAFGDDSYRQVINGADMATPDGAPVAWMLRMLGHAGQERVSGPDLMWLLLDSCRREGIGVYFYGSTTDTLNKLRARAHDAFPGLSIVGVDSPAFRSLTQEEDSLAVATINASGAGIVFVGLGCPKQEKWMAEHRGRVSAVMIGVGAAFDFHAGTVRRAPAWMRNNGLEWVHRLCSEPRRLWKRYLVTNSIFVFQAAIQLLRGRSA